MSLLERIEQRLVEEYAVMTVQRGFTPTTEDVQTMAHRICSEESAAERERLVMEGWLTNG